MGEVEEVSVEDWERGARADEEDGAAGGVEFEPVVGAGVLKVEGEEFVGGSSQCAGVWVRVKPVEMGQLKSSMVRRSR